MQKMDTTMGGAVVYEGGDVAQFAAALGTEPAEPAEDGTVVLDVRLPTFEVVAVPFPPGSGVIVRELGGFLPISADQLDTFTEAAR
jgi:hypothetical protein